MTNLVHVEDDYQAVDTSKWPDWGLSVTYKRLDCLRDIMQENLAEGLLKAWVHKIL